MMKPAAKDVTQKTSNKELRTMKHYARIFNQYRYQASRTRKDGLWTKDGNIGDCIQSLAIENIYGKLGIDTSALRLINRDDIKNYQGDKCILPMQAWFGHYAGVFPLPWSDDITPVFIGFHLNKVQDTRKKFVRENIHEKMKAFEPIGCRDRNTKKFLQSVGLDAYFSGCMTLTFDKRSQEPKNGKVFLVDPTKKTLEYLPQEIKDKADTSITHFYYWDEYPVTEKGAQAFEARAREILNTYKTEARLVITSKIHVAMPCVAMGIPVIFIHEDYDNERFDVLDGILPRYSPYHMQFIDWNPQAADIEDLKAAIIENAKDRILQKDNFDNLEKLKAITAQLKPIQYGCWKLKLFNLLLIKPFISKRIKKIKKNLRN